MFTRSNLKSELYSWMCLPYLVKPASFVRKSLNSFEGPSALRNWSNSFSAHWWSLSNPDSASPVGEGNMPFLSNIPFRNCSLSEPQERNYLANTQKTVSWHAPVLAGSIHMHRSISKLVCIQLSTKKITRKRTRGKKWWAGTIFISNSEKKYRTSFCNFCRIHL